MQVDYSDLKQGALEARTRAAQFEKQWMTWLTLASAGGLALMLSFSTGMVNRPLFAGDPEVRILGYGKEQMWKQIFT